MHILTRKQLLAIGALIILLVTSSIVFAVLYMTKDVLITGGISVIGTIEVYEEDGVTPLTSYDFSLFTGGVDETKFYDFVIGNTGNQPVYVYWDISASNITWDPYADGYYDNQGGWARYWYGIKFTDTGVPADNWAPLDYTTPEALFVDVGESRSLSIWCNYHVQEGLPVTESQGFELTMSFYAQDA